MISPKYKYHDGIRILRTVAGSLTIAWFLNLRTVYIWPRYFFKGGYCPVYCRMFNSILRFCLQMSVAPLPQTTKMSPFIHKCYSRGMTWCAKWPWVWEPLTWEKVRTLLACHSLSGAFLASCIASPLLPWMRLVLGICVILHVLCLQHFILKEEQLPQQLDKCVLDQT